MYALAASAAGVSVLALAQPAEAKIVYTKTHHVIGPDGTYHLSLNHKGTDFVIYEQGSWDGSSGIATLAVEGLGNNAVRGVSFGFESAAFRLPGGSVVSSRQTFVGNKKGAIMALYTCSEECGDTWGPWAYGGNGYLGLKFTIGKQVHYGWARLAVNKSGHYAFKAVLTGYAYETIPNKPIFTKVPDVITLESGSLGELAAGAAGLHSGK
jgi:hypothetical protein